MSSVREAYLRTESYICKRKRLIKLYGIKDTIEKIKQPRNWEKMG